MSSVSLLLKITKNSFLVQTEEYLNETINLNYNRIETKTFF